MGWCRCIFRKYLKLLHYSHFYFAFNTHDIWKLFFCQKYVNKKLAAFLGFPTNQKSRSAQFQNLIFNERRTLFSPLKYIKFILLVNLIFFFQKRFILNHFRYNYCCFHQFWKITWNRWLILTPTLKLMKTAIIVSKMISNEAFLKKKI